MKPFGDLVLNYLKKLHQSHNSWKKQLRFALYVQPIAILIVSFAGLIVTTDLFLHYFIDSQIDQRIQQQFAYLDQKYQNKDDYQIASTNLFEASYLILDKNSSIVIFLDKGIDRVVLVEIVKYFFLLQLTIFVIHTIGGKYNGGVLI